MKFTIEGLSQARLCELGLDAIDAVLLRWFIDFWPRMDKKLVLGEEYGWAAYAHVTKELPIMKIENVEVIARRFKKYRQVGLMDYHVDRGDNSKTYFKLVPEQWEMLTSDSRRLESREAGDSKVVKPATQKSDNPSSIDPSSNDSLLSASAPSKKPSAKVKDPEFEKTVRSLTDHYQALYMDEYKGVKPLWKRGIVDLVRDDLRRFGGVKGAQELGDLMTEFFENPGTFVTRNGTGMGYNIFHSQIDALLEKKRRAG